MKFKKIYTHLPISLQKSMEMYTEGTNAQVESLWLSEIFIVHLQDPAFGLSHVVLPLTGKQVEIPQELFAAIQISSFQEKKAVQVINVFSLARGNTMEQR